MGASGKVDGSIDEIRSIIVEAGYRYIGVNYTVFSTFVHVSNSP